jgi:hypothetical protein
MCTQPSCALRKAQAGSPALCQAAHLVDDGGFSSLQSFFLSDRQREALAFEFQLHNVRVMDHPGHFNKTQTYCLEILLLGAQKSSRQCAVNIYKRMGSIDMVVLQMKAIFRNCGLGVQTRLRQTIVKIKQ